MSGRTEQILLVDHDQEWAERFISQLQVRGWSICWTSDETQIYQDLLYSVYLLNLSHPNLDTSHACRYIRSLPKGENASIFLLNDGSAELRSFEDALVVKADGLYFHHAQLSLLLTNFPPRYRNTGETGVQSNATYNTFSNRHLNPQQSLEKDPAKDADTPVFIPEQPTLHNRERVLGMSLGHRNRQRLALGYSSDGLSVSEIEAAFTQAQVKEEQETLRRVRETTNQNLSGV